MGLNNACISAWICRRHAPVGWELAKHGPVWSSVYQGLVCTSPWIWLVFWASSENRTQQRGRGPCIMPLFQGSCCCCIRKLRQGERVIETTRIKVSGHSSASWCPTHDDPLFKPTVVGQAMDHDDCRGGSSWDHSTAQPPPKTWKLSKLSFNHSPGGGWGALL